jgi:hypothetical protein
MCVAVSACWSPAAPVIIVALAKLSRVGTRCRRPGNGKARKERKPAARRRLHLPNNNYRTNFPQLPGALTRSSVTTHTTHRPFLARASFRYPPLPPKHCTSILFPTWNPRKHRFLFPEPTPLLTTSALRKVFHIISSGSTSSVLELDFYTHCYTRGRPNFCQHHILTRPELRIQTLIHLYSLHRHQNFPFDCTPRYGKARQFRQHRQRTADGSSV